jgi:hypothetical protein
MLSELHNLNLKLYSKQYNKIVLLHLIVVPQLSGGWSHNYSTKTRQVGHANEQSMFSLRSMGPIIVTKVNKMTSFKGQASWTKRMSSWGKLTACLPSKKVNKVEELTYPSTNISVDYLIGKNSAASSANRWQHIISICYTTVKIHTIVCNSTTTEPREKILWFGILKTFFNDC